MENPHFSVIIPSYNNAPFLDCAIRSVVEQNYPFWELIVVDDGSHDGSVDICRRWCEKDQRIRFYCHEESRNKGVSATRNLGLSVALHPFIALLDSDDVWTGDKLERQSHAIQANPGVDLLYAKAEVIDESGTPVAHQPEKVTKLNRQPVFGSGPSTVSSDFLSFIKSPPRIPTSSVVFRKNGWTFDETLTNQVEDSLLFLQIVENGKVLFTPEVLVKYRVHGKQWNNTLDPIRKLNARFELYFRLLQKVAVGNRRLVCNRLMFESLSRFGPFVFQRGLENGVLRANASRFLLSGKVTFYFKVKFLFYMLRSFFTSSTPAQA